MTDPTENPSTREAGWKQAVKLASGLHVENNLEVMTALENMKKHNQFEVLP